MDTPIIKFINNKVDWDYCLSKIFPEYHLHYLYDYHAILAANGDGEPFMYLYQHEEKSFLHTFLKKKINQIGKIIIDDCYDIQVYGYVGPLSTSSDIQFNTAAYNFFSEWCREQNIISELIRFNPILSNSNLLIESKIQLVKLKPIVYLDLTLPENILFKKISSRTQKYLKKVQREFTNQIHISTETQDLQEFFELYKTHMINLGANSYYLFSKIYYEKLIEFVKNYGFLIYARIEGKLIAGIIQLFINNTAYPHHGARDTAMKESSIIYKYLLWRSMILAKEKNMKIGLLGAGVSERTSDTLLQFKMVFDPVITDLYIGKMIHHQEKHQEICKIWEKEYPNLVSLYSSYIDKYRFTD